MSIFGQPHVRKDSYMHHRHLVKLAFIPRHWTLGSMPWEVVLEVKTFFPVNRHGHVKTVRGGGGGGG